MDQAAFRSLLSTPRPASSSSSSTAHPKFGAAPPKRVQTESKDEFKKPEFKPRAKKFKKKDDGGAEADGAYRDRAAERRGGKDGDFSAAERLLEDFKARTEGSEDKEAVEEQMKYLGGDAEHSVLVKGLDMALLERMKHEQSRESDRSIEDVEKELDKVLSTKPKKRTRDEMVADLKAAREAAASAGPVSVEDTSNDEAAALEKAKAAGRFKPINQPSGKKGKGKGKEAPVPMRGEKKRRKKVKAVEGAMPPPPPAPTGTSKPTVAVPLYADVDEDADIFGGAGEYKGLDLDSDDDETLSKAPPPAPPVAPPLVAGASKRKYFDDDDEEEFTVSTAPSAVSNLAANVAAAKTAGKAGRSGNGEEGEEGEEEEEEERPMRLQPLSGSSLPSVRDLLDMDKAAEKEEQRKAKKLRNKDKDGTSEKREKVRTEEDKANHDFQVMTKFLENKEKRKNGIPVEDD